MDRGRVGFNAIGNKCIRENMVSLRYSWIGVSLRMYVLLFIRSMIEEKLILIN